MTPPSSDPAFHWTAEAWGFGLRCGPLSAIAQHVFTTKQLQLRGGPEEQPIGWTQAITAVGGGLDRLMRVKQVHGAHVRVLRKGQVAATDVASKPEGDAIVANASGLVLAVQVADCVPILIADPSSGAAAAVHAGWRGSSAQVARAAVAAMAREFGASPRDMVAAIGPSIGPCCYVVGRSVLESFRQAGVSEEQIATWFTEAEGTLRLDLWTANRDQLLAAGLAAGRVHVSRLCTQTHHDMFESYRVDGERAGRMAALVTVP